MPAGEATSIGALRPARDSLIASVGAVLAIETWVAIQFFEVTIVDLGSYPLSIQKLVALVVFPFALLAMHQWLLPRTLLLLLALMLLANSLWYVSSGSVTDSRVLGADFTAISVAFGATVLYTALVAVGHGIDRMGRAWVRWAWITSGVCVLQSFGVLPLFNVPPEMLVSRATVIGLDRAVGFKQDPNFQALMLVIGALALSLLEQRPWRRAVGLLAIGMGILSTFSRMGLLLYALVVLGGPALKVLNRKGTRHALLILGVTVLGAAGLVGLAVARGVLPPQIQAFLATRFLGAWRALAAVSGGQGAGLPSGAVDSAVTRLVLALASVKLFLANPWIGIGAGRSEDMLVAMTGLSNVAHNTYLEMAVTGGMVGVCFLVTYGVPLFRLMASSGASARALGEEVRLRSWGIAQYAVFAFVFLLLSLNTNSILYLPVVSALALMRERPSGAHLRATA